jgi:hypothetical protein
MSEVTEPLPTPAPSRFWINDSAGHPSITVTFLTIAFVVTTIAYAGAMFDSIGPLHFRAFDSAACAAYMSPVMALYLGRRYTDARYGNPNAPQVAPGG